MPAPTPTPAQIAFADFDFRFTAHPQTGQLIIRKNNEAIAQAVKLLVLTGLTERPFRPFLGSAIGNQLFENFSPFVVSEIKDSVARAIRNIEPRAKLLDVRTVPNPDRNSLEVSVIFRAVNATQPTTVTISFDKLR